MNAARDAANRDGRQLGFLWGGISLFLIAISPLGNLLAGALPACLFKSWFGFPCPTCGTTRAALALAQFDFVHALTNYPLQSLGWIVFLVGGLTAGLLAWRGLPLPSLPRRIPLWIRTGAVSAVLANWAYAIHLGI